MMNLIPHRKRQNLVFPFEKLQNDMNSLFNYFFEDFPLTSLTENKHSFAPNIDVQETNKEIKITAELPGLDEKDIDISLVDNVLTIQGEKKHEVEEEKDNFHHIERSYGKFYRNIPLPVEIVTDKVEAKFNKGILYISLPKTEQVIAKAKRIEIKTG